MIYDRLPISKLEESSSALLKTLPLFIDLGAAVCSGIDLAGCQRVASPGGVLDSKLADGLARGLEQLKREGVPVLGHAKLRLMEVLQSAALTFPKLAAPVLFPFNNGGVEAIFQEADGRAAIRVEPDGRARLIFTHKTDFSRCYREELRSGDQVTKALSKLVR